MFIVELWVLIDWVIIGEFTTEKEAICTAKAIERTGRTVRVFRQ